MVPRTLVHRSSGLAAHSVLVCLCARFAFGIWSTLVTSIIGILSPENISCSPSVPPRHMWLPVHVEQSKPFVLSRAKEQMTPLLLCFKAFHNTCGRQAGLQRLSVCKSVHDVSYCAGVCIHTVHAWGMTACTIVWSSAEKQSEETKSTANQM